MTSSRIDYAKHNIVSGLIFKAISTILPFFVRATIVQKLGSEYLGLDGFFTSLLQMLNLAELGFNNAIIYNMYKPIAKDDRKQICALLNLYRKVYRIVGTTILTIGIVIVPILPNLIHGNISMEVNFYILYYLYLFNTVISYWLFAHKSAILTAFQRNDINNNCQALTQTLKYLAQLAVIYLIENYYLFVIVEIITTTLYNLIINNVTNKIFPQYICQGDITKETRKHIKYNIFGLIIQRVCATTRNSLDSVFVSMYLGLNIVAVYTNYYSIMAAITSIMNMITTTIIPTIGNSVVTESEKKNYNDMNKLNFLYMWISGWAMICLACLYQPFMELWMGKENMFDYSTVILFCVYFYALKLGDVRAAYSDACGLWYESKGRAIAESMFNIILNIVLGKIFGVNGIVAGTLISLLIINFGYGSQILFKHYFVHQKISEYFIRHGVYALTTTVICIVTVLISNLVPFGGVPGLIMKGIVCIAIPNILYFAIYFKTKSFQESVGFIKKVIRRR